MRSRIAAVLPWVFVIGVAVGSLLPLRKWVHIPGLNFETSRSWPDPAAEILGGRTGGADIRLPVEVLRTIDGDTFVARVRLRDPDRTIVTRVRLRGVDAPELKAACEKEWKMAQAASGALRALLNEGGVTIYNVGSDKYAGRVVADAATTRTSNISSALLAAGQVRRYDGGHRNGWCRIWDR
ncbi:thermonuclease family protein [Bradyrhizobium prioriisuperbiae]|uniref:thermonuclease family protein n=1 Tax=Bradyrhizobium prioriisuperbiae TaxID=2854389 RepID=UPI0028F14EA7|nr:thermonuclease family protein [Bradyrhizobium prioritasuperba]